MASAPRHHQEHRRPRDGDARRALRPARAAEDGAGEEAEYPPGSATARSATSTGSSARDGERERRLRRVARGHGEKSRRTRRSGVLVAFAISAPRRRRRRPGDAQAQRAGAVVRSHRLGGEKSELLRDAAATPTPATPTHPRIRVPRCRSHATSEAPAPTRPEAAMTTGPRRDAHRAAGTPTTLRARNSNARESVPSVCSSCSLRRHREGGEPNRTRTRPARGSRTRRRPAPNARARGAGADARAIPNAP